MPLNQECQSTKNASQSRMQAIQIFLASVLRKHPKHFKSLNLSTHNHTTEPSKFPSSLHASSSTKPNHPLIHSNYYIYSAPIHTFLCLFTLQLCKGGAEQQKYPNLFNVGQPQCGQEEEIY
jgi:hypothetical protein